MNNRLFSAETILGVVVSFLLCSSNASAQSYVGGSFNFWGSSSNKSISNSSIDSQTSQSFSVQVAPDFGWFVGDRWAVGIRPWMGFTPYSSVVGDNNQSSRSFSLGINPYARYRLLALHRFGLWVEADPELAFLQTQSKVQGREWTSNNRSTAYSLGFVPVLTYQLNNHISLESQLNLFSFRLQGTHEVNVNNDERNSFSWGLQATTKNVMESLCDISIGFLYKF